MTNLCFKKLFWLFCLMLALSNTPQAWASPDDIFRPQGNRETGIANLTPPPLEEHRPDTLTGCAADTWNAMVNQSVMQMRREDIVNKRFIIKPDSVLDYSCFDMHVKKTADIVGPIFSESTKWANLDVNLLGKSVTIKRNLGSTSLDGALMDIVESVAANYRAGQFNNAPLAETTNVNLSNAEGNCNLMSEVWRAAKCKNFDAPEVFYSFADLVTQEPRQFPSNMGCN